MLKSTPKRHLLPQVHKLSRCFSTALQGTEDEYTNTPQYPPILDMSPEKVKERKIKETHEAIRAVKTVEEKQIKLNMPKYYGFKRYLFNENEVTYNALPLVQHITRTHLIEDAELPKFYNDINVDQLFDKVKAEVEEAILFEQSFRKKADILQTESTAEERENLIAASVSRNLNRIIVNNVSETHKHLKTADVDYDPRIQSFWFAGGMPPTKFIRNCRRGVDFLKHTENDPIDRAIQYTGMPSVTLRSNLPLLPVVPLSEAENPALEVPCFNYDPRVAWVFTDYNHGVNVPGFWPGEKNQFSLISYHKKGHFVDRNFNDPGESKDALNHQGILASFGWLNAVANFLGFTTFNEITYPLVTQTIITNGQLFSFYVYQLNTLLFHSKNAEENPRRNICWASGEFKLYENIEDGKLIGFNDDVLKKLLKFYVNIPEERLGVNLRPYLGAHEKVIADYADDDKRTWLEREYKHIMSNRPRQKLPYEVYNWEKIYKIDHKTRPMDKRLRPFELFQNPYTRTLDDRQPFYIPRCERPDLPRNKGRYKKEYWP